MDLLRNIFYTKYFVLSYSIDVASTLSYYFYQIVFLQFWFNGYIGVV